MTLYEFKNTKAGMTLVEMVVSLAILSILMTSTMGMIVSSNSIFISTSQATLDKSVGNSVFDLLENVLKYTTHLEISDTRNTGMKQCISVTEKDSTNKCGYIYYKGEDDTNLAPLYDSSFYGNDRYVQYCVKEVGTDGKHVNLTVNVYRGGEKVYTREQIVRCVNLALISGDNGNAIEESDEAPEYNQVISFSVDEMLFAGGSSAWNIEYKMASYISKYNTILKEYYGYLTTAIAKVNSLYDQYNDSANTSNYHLNYTVYDDARQVRDYAIYGVKDFDKSASSVKNLKDNGKYNGTVTFNGGDDSSQWCNMRQYYQKQIYDLLGFSPQTITDSSDVYYKVIASKEELYTGFLLTYYDKNPKDGVVSYEEFPSFDDPEEFFYNTVMYDYATADDNKMVILAYSRDDSNDFKKNGSYYDPYYSVELKDDLTVAVGNPEVGVANYSARVYYGSVASYTTEWERYVAGWSTEGTNSVYYMEDLIDTTNLIQDENGNAKNKNYVNSCMFTISGAGSKWNANYSVFGSNYGYSIMDPGTYTKTTKYGKTVYKRVLDPYTCKVNVTFNYYSDYAINSNCITYTNNGQKTDYTEYICYYNGSEYIKYDASSTNYLMYKMTNKADSFWYGDAYYFGYESYTPSATNFTYTTDQQYSAYDYFNRLRTDLGAKDIESVATYKSSATQTVYYSSKSNCAGVSADRCTRYVFEVSGDVKEGWYYYKYGTASGNYSSYIKTYTEEDSNAEKYVFFYLDAVVYNESVGDTSTDVNYERLAMDKNSKRKNGNDSCEVQIFFKDGNAISYSYDRAAFVLNEDGETCVLVPLDGSSTGTENNYSKVRYYTVKCHQYTDYILYGVDWASWFGTSTKGLVNTALNWIVSLFTTSTNITSISASNSTQSLGRVGKYDVSSTVSTSVHSYDAAWIVYNTQTGTWYYLPADSSMASTTLTGVSWSSVKNQPTILDVDTDWASSTALEADIKSMKYTSPGVFGITYVAGVDMSATKDVNWQSLPTGGIDN